MLNLSVDSQFVFGVDHVIFITFFQDITGIVGSVNGLNTIAFQPRNDLNIDPSTLTWEQSGVYRVNANHPVNGISDGFLVHFSAYKSNGVWLQLLAEYGAQRVYMRGNWYETVRNRVQI